MGGSFNKLFASRSLLLLSALLGAAIAQLPPNADPNSPMELWYRPLSLPRSGA